MREGLLQGQSSKAWMDTRSFADVVHNRHVKDNKGAYVMRAKTIFFTSEKDELDRYSKAFIGVIKEVEVAVKLQQIFHEEGLFSIRLTLLGPIICLLKIWSVVRWKLLLRSEEGGGKTGSNPLDLGPQTTWTQRDLHG